MNIIMVRTKRLNHIDLFKIIFSEEHNSREDARKREIYLKSGIGKEFLKTLFK